MTEHCICPTCGAKSVEYKFGLNKGLAIFLGKLFDANGPAKTDSLGLTYAQRTNSQKLRYWGLASQVITEETEHKRGWWEITEKGKQFVIGRIEVPRYAVTRSNVVQRLEGDPISFDSISDGYEFRGDYSDIPSCPNEGDSPFLNF